MASLHCIVFISHSCSCEALQNTDFGIISHLVYFSNLVSSFLGQIALPSYFVPWVPAMASLQLPASNLSSVGSILHIVASVILNCKSGSRSHALNPQEHTMTPRINPTSKPSIPDSPFISCTFHALATFSVLARGHCLRYPSTQLSRSPALGLCSALENMFSPHLRLTNFYSFIKTEPGQRSHRKPLGPALTLSYDHHLLRSPCPPGGLNLLQATKVSSSSWYLQHLSRFQENNSYSVNTC